MEHERNDTRAETEKHLLKLEEAAEIIRDAIRLLKKRELVPMTFILSKVPGDTITEKAEVCGVSRQTYYYWLQGRSRPAWDQAVRLASITGVPVADIIKAS
jgi:DNA-binding XRE family transcriptional regulator